MGNPVRAGLVSLAGDWPYQGEFVFIDRAKLFAAETAASTPESSRATDLYRARVASAADPLNGLG
jgi:hypothetical protein